MDWFKSPMDPYTKRDLYFGYLFCLAFYLIYSLAMSVSLWDISYVIVGAIVVAVIGGPLCLGIVELDLRIAILEEDWEGLGINKLVRR